MPSFPPPDILAANCRGNCNLQPAHTAMNWYYAEGTEQRGPVSEQEFNDMVASGRITGTTLVWREGLPNWVPYAQVNPQASGAPPQMPSPAVGPGMAMGTYESAKKAVQPPAIFLLVSAGLTLLSLAYQVVAFSGGGMPFMAVPVPPEMQDFVKGGMWIGIAFMLVILIVTSYGAWKMLHLESYGLAVAACVLSLLCGSPSCCCPTGLIAGIWGLVVLLRPGVKDAFS